MRRRASRHRVAGECCSGRDPAYNPREVEGRDGDVKARFGHRSARRARRAGACPAVPRRPLGVAGTGAGSIRERVRSGVRGLRCLPADHGKCQPMRRAARVRSSRPAAASAATGRAGRRLLLRRQTNPRRRTLGQCNAGVHALSAAAVDRRIWPDVPECDRARHPGRAGCGNERLQPMRQVERPGDMLRVLPRRLRARLRPSRSHPRKRRVQKENQGDVQETWRECGPGTVGAVRLPWEHLPLADCRGRVPRGGRSGRNRPAEFASNTRVLARSTSVSRPTGAR